ncbi:hypothetical protein H1R20_g4545, partial [Candolleomyces eurysporus]
MDPLLKKILSESFPVSTSLTLLRETMTHIARYARALEAAVPEDALMKQASIPPLVKGPSHTLQESSVTSIGATIALSAPAKDFDLEQRSTLVHDFNRSMTLTGANDRFFGPSSMSALVDATAMELREASQNHLSPGPGRAITMKKHMRPEFWSVLPWEQPPPIDNTPLDFPPPDLLNELVGMYFAYVNAYFPFMHRPTLEKGIQSGLHLSCTGFGMVVLGVCAVASRYSNDPRVLLEGTTSLFSNGFKWFRQIKLFHESSQRAPSLYDLQALYLSITYRHGSSTPEQCWYLIGYGIRAAQDIGLNRRNLGLKPTVENELRKRVFWMFILADSLVSAAVGRPPAVELSDLDLELPIDCDDEYWENSNPEVAFKQPAGIPSRVSFFCSMIELIKIHHNVQRAFYSVTPKEPPPGISPGERDRLALVNIDSALNAWVDSVPDHRASDLLLEPSDLSHSLSLAAQNAGIRSIDEEREMKAVQACIDVLKKHETRWHAAGRFRDILTTLASAGLPPQSTGPPRAKRPRNEDTDYPNQEVMVWPAITTPPLSDSSTNSSQTMEFSRLRDPPPPSTFIQALVSTPESPPPYSTVPTDAIPLYICDLSKPFPPFNQMDGEHNLAWKRQLDELDALWGEVSSGEDQTRRGANIMAPTIETSGFGSHNLSANPPTFASPIESSGPISSRGPPLSTFPPSDAYASNPGSDLLGVQDATLWTDFPMGHSLDDWGPYFSHMDALSAAHFQQDPHSSHIVESQSFSYLSGDQGTLAYGR